MIEIKYLPSALRDMKRLHDFVFDKNPVAAHSAISAIQAGINNINDFPEIGKPIDNLPTEFRKLNIPFEVRC